ncbi:MAG: hypothetical protein IJX38_01680 [Clostridia bacterium]|nr:hypothetical protein [Clostridia bacterium]
MIKRHVYVDFSKKCGKIYPVGCANTGPLFGIDLSVDFSEEYRKMSVPYVRTHNVEHPHGGGRYVDIHNVFPVWELDERFEASYNFAPTDKYLSAIKAAGGEIFLRIGESSDPYEIKPYLAPPRDPMKWARIAERIIRHYNNGWARGFKHGIRYVEIMADVDDPRGWSGSRVEFYELYRTVSTYLKEKFPRLKIGGYSSGGFFSLNHFNATDIQRGYVDFLEGFLEYIGSPRHRAPLDFFTWKCFAETPEELSLHANYARNYLDQSGFRKTESIISEFNLASAAGGEMHLDRDYPAALMTSLIIAAKSNINMMFYADSDPRRSGCALYSVEDRTSKRLYAPYRAMEAFGELVRLGGAVDVSEDFRREIYSLAATDGTSGALLLVTRDYSGVIELGVKGMELSTYSIRGLIGGGERGAGFTTSAENIAAKDNKVLLRTGKNEVYLITFAG